ncbi:MAG: RNA polymerase sigma factor [Chitinophagales bacterium]
MTENKEQALLKGMANNQREAIESIYSQHFQMVQTLVLNNSGTTEDAKDIFQEAIIVLYEKTRTGTFVLNCLIKTYVYSVSRRLWLKRLQQQQKFTPETNGVEEMIAVDEDMEAHEQRNADYQLMEKAMAGLGEPCKSLLESYYLQKKSMVEIATDFGYTNADNAKNQKYKCLMRLKKIFFDQYSNTTSDARNRNA